MGAAKRAHNPGGMTAAQKAEMLDEESEEEDFSERPLMLKDIRARAEQAVQRKRRREKKHPLQDDALRNGFSASMTTRSHDPSGAGDKSMSAIESTHASHVRYGSGGRRTDDQDGLKGSQDDDEDGLGGDSDGSDVAVLALETDAAGLLDDESSADGKRQSMVEMGKSARSRRLSQLVGQPGQKGLLSSDVNEEELDIAFLQRYKMSKDELQIMANRMGIHLSNLCFLKAEFDLYDEDFSGYIDARELRGLLRKLGEELSDDELDAAFKDLDQDGSGEIEFFEFVEWFTSPDSTT